MEKLREENWESRKERALERLRRENERSRDTVDSDWENRVSRARERLRESKQAEVPRREIASYVDPEVEGVEKEVEMAESKHRESERVVRTTLDNSTSETGQMEAEIKEQREQMEAQQEMESAHKHLNEHMKEDRIEEEYSIKDSAPQQIPGDIVEESLATLRDSESVDAKAVVDAIDSLVCNTLEMESRVKVANLNQSGIENSRLKEIEDILQNNKEYVREALSEKLEKDTRVGVVREKLYIWTPNGNPNDMINGWKTQYFYMDTESLLNMIKKVDSKLELDDVCAKNTENFNNLIQQLTSDSRYKQLSIKEKQSRVTGESLNLIRDVIGIEAKDLERMIHKVTGANGHGGIHNPRLREGQELEVLRARLMATAVSDCYVRPDGMLEYYEENLERIERFKDETLRGFGDFFKEPRYMEQHGYYRLKISSPYGRALNEWGIPSGDRTIRNYGLPRETEDWSEESVSAYLQDMTSEEGHVAENKIRWQRSNALHAGAKTDDYDLEPRTSQEHVELIKGRRKGYAGEYDGEHTLRWTRLKELRHSEDPKIAKTARELCKIVRENRNRLMDDEEKLAKKLGIELVIRPEEITYYEESGRVSVKWEARTIGADAMIRWALMCPPNHPEKEVALKKWLTERKAEDVRRIVDDLEKEGLEIKLEGS